jgi:hypothetical protein
LTKSPLQWQIKINIPFHGAHFLPSGKGSGLKKKSNKLIQEKMKDLNKNQDDNDPFQPGAFFRIGQFDKRGKVPFHTA